MKLYNTLTRKKEEFTPLIPGEVRMYSCGPTVYNYAHIGNMRTYVFMDILRRALRREGYTLNGIMNITDVGHLTSDGDTGEDKMALAAKKQNKTPWEIAAYYTDVFMADLEKLNIRPPERLPKATEHIPEMIEFVQGLVEKGYGYETEDGIYFDIMKYGRYGQLSGIKLEDQISGARVEVNEGKRHPADFALWKKAPKEHIMQWESPWGMGYPGWHIECSAMGKKYFGDQFDIHTGGVDHIPVHHENEIAQSWALTGKIPARVWMHGEFMMVDNGKMSKSLGNTYTVSDLEKKGVEPLAFRYFCLNAHYRNKLNFTWEAQKAAQVAYDRLREAVAAHKGADGVIEQAKIDEYTAEFNAAVADDLNVPKALGILWSMLRGGVRSDAIWRAAMDMDEVLGLRLDTLPAREEIPAEAVQLAEERAAARKNKDWATADRLRDELKAMGYEIKDAPGGYEIKKA